MSLMEFRSDQRQGQNQSQTLSPRLQHAVRLLQMSSLDFAAVVQATLGRNPFLETEDAGDSDGGDDLPLHDLPLHDRPDDRRALADADDGTDGLTPIDAPGLADSADDGGDPRDLRDAGDSGEIEERWDSPDGPDSRDGDGGDGDDSGRDDDLGGDRDLWQADAGSGVRRGEDGELSALERMAEETCLNVHLHAQLSLLPLSPRDAACARTIVESLDDDGYLRSPLDSLLDVAALDPAASLAEMQIALRRVQSLEPAGVGARDVAECLLLQLPAIDCPRTQDLARRIVGQHLQALAARDVAGLARRLGETPACVEAVCDRIRRLDPRPGWRLGASQVAYVVPDVVVKKQRGRWVVQLNPAVVPRVRLNHVYASLFQRHRSAHSAELGAHLHEARWTLRNVEQRFATIVDVAEAIVERQKSFLDYGAMAMKPLGLKEIAQAVGVHESTVSRVTNNKYMATPNGIFELKYFFSRAMLTSNGRACSGTAIRGLIHDMIAAESPEQPLSDAEITRQLSRQGLVVARRTVTKYRQLLKFDAVDRRRRVA